MQQDGKAGACGSYHSDDDLVVALDQALYGDGGYCGKSVTITKTSSGASVTAVVADECMGCDGEYSLDLSIATMDALGGGGEVR